MDSKDFDKLVEELQEYARLEGSEIGEVCGLLCEIYQYYPSYMSEAFKAALKTEIKENLENFKEHCKIVEKLEEVTERWKELEWI